MIKFILNFKKRHIFTTIDLHNSLNASKRLKSLLFNLFMLQLTCATQMTSWQPADDHNFPMCQQNNEIMELSRIISQLAMANHQLASVHNATLARVEALHLELSKDRQDRKISTNSSEIRNDSFRKKLSDTEETIEREEVQRLEQRVVRLEELLAESSAEQCKQRDSRQDNKLHSRIERLENLLKTRDINNQSRSVESHCESSEQQTDNIFDIINKVPEDCGDNQRKSSREEVIDVYRYCNAYSNDFEIIVPTIDKIFDSTNIDKMRRRRARLKDDEQNLTTRNLASEEILKLSEEIERLKTDRVEDQNTNERLLRNLADQKTVIKKLNVDYEVWYMKAFDFKNSKKESLNNLYLTIKMLLYNYRII